MITFFRKNKRGIVGTLMVGMCVVLMLPFGVEYFGNDATLSQATVAEVGGSEISALSYDRSLYQFQSMLKKQFGENYDKIAGMINVKQKILDDLINKKVIQDVLQKSEFVAGVSHVEAYIRNLPIFSGAVSRETFSSFLKAQGLTEQQFKKEIEEAIIFDQFENIFRLAASYSPSELEKRYTKSQQKVILSYARVRSTKAQPEVKEEEITSYYESNKQRFTTDKTFKLRVLSIPYSLFESKVVIHEDDYNDAYQRHKREFIVPQRAKLEILSFQKKAPDFLEDTGAPKIDFEKLAQATYQEVIKNPASFSEIAKSKGASYRKDEELKETSVLAKEIRNKLQSLSANSVSEVIETAGDYTIVKVIEIQQEAVKPLSEVKSEVEKHIKKDLAPEFALVRADQIKAEVLSLDASKVIEFLENLKTKESFSLEVLQANETQLPEHMYEAISASTEGSSVVISREDAIELVYVEQVKAPQQKDLALVSDEIKRTLVSTKQKEQSLALAKEILVSAKNVGTFVTYQGFKELIKKYNLEMSDVEGSIGQLKVPFLSPDATTSMLISEIVMHGTHRNPVEGMDGEVYIFVLKEIPENATQMTAQSKKEFAEALEKKTAQSLEKIYTDYLKSKTTIKINNDVLERF